MTTAFTLRMGVAPEAGENRFGFKCPRPGHSPSRCGDLDAGNAKGITSTDTLLVPFGIPRVVASLITREDLEAAISGLIDILDVIDRDADLEGDFREDDAGDAREMDEDREPILGWTESERQTFGPARYGDISVYDEDEQ